jgi:dihydrofolate synthase/folylpolyglutamate synthase
MFQHSGSSAYKPGLQTISELDDFYGNPHKQYRTIHVAGTNGKGSVSHMIAAILQGAGYKTGLFTSPHLLDFRERIRIDGQMITEAEVVDFVQHSRPMFDKVGPSFFEMTVAMAFYHFAKNKVDVAVIETGMGGRLDATNVIKPILSIITNIGMDHTQYLGSNLISIASEKAGIIKKGIPVVIGQTQAGIKTVFEEKAYKSDSHIVFADEHAKVVQASITERGLSMQIQQKDDEKLQQIELDLCGDYQKKNIITVLISLQCLRYHAKLDIAMNTVLPSLSRAAQMTGLRGRWQKISDKPLIICDVAHNIDGWTWISQQIKTCSYKKLHIVIGFVHDKDISGMLELMPTGAKYYFTKASVRRSLCENELFRLATLHNLKGEAFTNVEAAYIAAKKNAAKEDMIFVGGSTFVVADMLNIL